MRLRCFGGGAAPERLRRGTLRSGGTGHPLPVPLPAEGRTHALRGVPLDPSGGGGSALDHRPMPITCLGPAPHVNRCVHPGRVGERCHGGCRESSPASPAAWWTSSGRSIARNPKWIHTVQPPPVIPQPSVSNARPNGPQTHESHRFAKRQRTPQARQERYTRCLARLASVSDVPRFLPATPL